MSAMSSVMGSVVVLILKIALPAIGILAIWKRDDRLLKLFGVSIVCVLGLGVVGLALSVAARHTLKYDLWLYSAETALGSPAFAIGRLLRPTRLYPVLVAVYEALPIALLLVYAAHLLARGGVPGRVLAAYALNFGVGYCVYLLLPACGPGYAFPGFPAASPALTLDTLKLVAPPNCMPSLHTSTAILAYWFCRRWRFARAVALINLVLTVFATLATGEHYAVDLVAAVPFAVFVYAASERRYHAAAAWLALVLMWCGALRFGPAYISAEPRAFLIVCLVTIVGAWLYAAHMHSGWRARRAFERLARQVFERRQNAAA